MVRYLVATPTRSEGYALGAPKAREPAIRVFSGTWLPDNTRIARHHPI